ncbi:MAG: hypothetical protein ACI4XM_01640 [Candidatus Coprovivens sp.]
MSNMDNFRYKQSEFQTAISDLQTSRNKQSESFENTKATLRDELLATGMSGTTAEALLVTFENEVVKPAEEYLATADHFINQNQMVEDEMASNSADNVKTATM